MFEIYKSLADYLVYQVLHLPPNQQLALTFHFFIYDTLKIFTLLTLVIFLISLVRSYFPIEKTRHILSKHRVVALPLAALLGVVTPFCSCSAVPMFIGFVEAGIPLSAAFTFLVASPMVNEVALGLLISVFGFKVAAAYLTFGIAVAMLSVFLIGKLKPENLVGDYIFQLKVGETKERELTLKERLNYAAENVKAIMSKIWLYITVAIFIGGFIHGYVPENFVEDVVKGASFLSVPLAVAIGIPLYSNSAGILPVIQALISKGVPLGTALAFMMATTALSLPEFMILKQVMKPKLIAMFAIIVATSIVMAGYLFNLLF
ncbi:permease [Hydrogenobacter thermophilus]|uniref:permease n=1 Tax=Hydrogenobacter thermophilus TaxID=940 RepID=UPI0030FA2BFB